MNYGRCTHLEGFKRGGRGEPILKRVETQLLSVASMHASKPESTKNAPEQNSKNMRQCADAITRTS